MGWRVRRRNARRRSRPRIGRGWRAALPPAFRSAAGVRRRGPQRYRVGVGIRSVWPGLIPFAVHGFHAWIVLSGTPK
jgi:hypothetical protein